VAARRHQIDRIRIVHQAERNGNLAANYRLPRAKTLICAHGTLLNSRCAQPETSLPLTGPMSLPGSQIDAGIPKRSKGLGYPGSKNLIYHAPSTARSINGVPPSYRRLCFISPPFHPRETARVATPHSMSPRRAFSRLAIGRRNVRSPRNRGLENTT